MKPLIRLAVLCSYLLCATLTYGHPYSSNVALSADLPEPIANLSVNPSLPLDSCAGPDNSITLCVNASAFDLLDLIDESVQGNGMWQDGSGSGSNMFEPSAAGIGTHTFFYDVDCGGGYIATSTITVTVTNPPSAGQDLLLNPCQEPGINLFLDLEAQLIGLGANSGGQFLYSGNPNALDGMLFLNGSTFNFGQSGIGLFEFLYIVDGNGCEEDTSVVGVGVVQTIFVNAGNDTESCGGQPVIINGSVSPDMVPFQWSSSGDGSFINGSSANPEYVPGTQDYLDGQVTISISSSAQVPPSCSASNTNDSMVLTIIDNPDAGPDTSITVCGLSANLMSYFAQPNGTFTGPNGFISVDGSVSAYQYGDNVFTYSVGSGQCIDQAQITVTFLPDGDAGNDYTLTSCTEPGTAISIDIGDLLNGNENGVLSYTGNPDAIDGMPYVDGTFFSTSVYGAYEFYYVVNTPTCGIDTSLVQFTLIPAPEVDIGPDIDICCGDTVFLDASVSAGYDSLLWSSLGDGVFLDNGDTISAYVPGAVDCASGQIYITLTALDYDLTCINPGTTDALFVDVIGFALAGNDAVICGDTSYVLGGWENPDGSISWSTSGDGLFSDPSDPEATYTAGTNDLNGGPVDLVLTSITSGCTNLTDTVTLEFFNANDPICQSDVSGMVFHDADFNSIFNGLDVGLAFQTVVLEPGGYVGITNDFGQFLFEEVPVGEYTISVNFNVLFPFNTTSATVDLTVGAENPDPVLFGLSEQMLEYGICIDLYPLGNGYPCDELSNHNICFRNMSNSTIDGVVEIEYDPLFQGFAEVTPIDSAYDNKIWMSFENLQPGIMYFYDVELHTPTVDYIGEFLTSTARIWGVNQNDTVAYGEQVLELEVTCAYDPNDKQVFPIGYSDSHYIESNTELEYLIRFQNTGNAPATDVRVIDTLSADLDISTFELVANSHSVFTSIDPNTRVVDFYFQDIMLPDSINNEPESHGLVSFKIRPNLGIPLLTEINNTASIFFDNNPPIVTNTTWSTTYDCSLFEVDFTADGAILTASEGDHYQWYLDGQVIAGANEQLYTALETGDYSVQVDSDFPCSGASASTFVIITSLSELAEEGIYLFPNPMTEQAILQLDGFESAVRIEIFDVQGRLIRSEQEIGSDTKVVIQREGLSAGQYMLKVSDASKNRNLIFVVD